MLFDWRTLLDGDNRILCSLNEQENLQNLCSFPDDIAEPILCAARTAPVAKASAKKRAGARKVKDFEKAQALAVAHLLGAGGAIEYLNGTDGKDGFGTSGSKYAEAIKTALSS